MGTLQQRCHQLVTEISKVVIGRESAIQMMLKAMLSGGHILLEDVPGVGKTMLAKALTQAVGFSFRRIQLTPDLFPADLIGVTVPSADGERYTFRSGPIFAQIILADELNRAMPKTQSALLEAMEEKKVTVDGESYPLPAPFIVIATQNPVEYGGTYRLPEAQLDRFMVRISLGYPEQEAEIRMLDQLLASSEDPLQRILPVISTEQFFAMQEEVHRIYVADSIKRYVIQLSYETRNHPDIQLGISPRATMALIRAAQSEAWFAGRDYVIPDDVKTMMPPVFSHRLILNEFAADDLDAESICAEILNRVKIPAFTGVTA